MRGLALWSVAVAAIAVAALAQEPTADRLAGALRVEAALDGALVAALEPTPDDGLFVLVRPAGDPDGERRLLRVRGGAAPTVDLVGEALGGWMKTLVAVDLGRGPELAAAGLGRLVALGPLSRPLGPARPLVEHPGLDLRSLRPEPLRTGIEHDIAAAEVGALRLWRSDGAGGLELAADLGLPFAVERGRSGLRLAGPRVVELPRDGAGRRGFVVGPEAAGAARLRLLLVAAGDDGEWTTTEGWAALPAPETVEESWIAAGDDGPLLVVRSQGALELNAFENQLWRIFRIAPDRTRRGRRAALAWSVDSKRWHDNAASIADVDGDGHVDLLIARPEGLSGADLVVERYAGRGRAQFDPRSRRTDLDRAPESFHWLADVDGDGRPGLVTIVEGELVVWKTARSGRRALEREPSLRVAVRQPDAPEKSSLRWLGSLPRAGAAPDQLVLARSEAGDERLVWVRPEPR